MMTRSDSLLSLGEAEPEVAQGNRFLSTAYVMEACSRFYRGLGRAALFFFGLGLVLYVSGFLFYLLYKLWVCFYSWLLAAKPSLEIPMYSYLGLNLLMLLCCLLGSICMSRRTRRFASSEHVEFAEFLRTRLIQFARTFRLAPDMGISSRHRAQGHADHFSIGKLAAFLLFLAKLLLNVKTLLVNVGQLIDMTYIPCDGIHLARVVEAVGVLLMCAMIIFLFSNMVLRFDLVGPFYLPYRNGDTDSSIATLYAHVSSSALNLYGLVWLIKRLSSFSSLQFLLILKPRPPKIPALSFDMQGGGALGFSLHAYACFVFFGVFLYGFLGLSILVAKLQALNVNEIMTQGVSGIFVSFLAKLWNLKFNEIADDHFFILLGFANQMLSFVDAEELQCSRLLTFLFARRDSVLQPEERSLLTLHMVGMMWQVWCMPHSNVGCRIIAIFTFGAADYQKRVLEERVLEDGEVAESSAPRSYGD